MKKVFSAHNLYLAIWIIYYLQGYLYSVGSLVSQFSLMAFMLISVYYVIYSNIHYKLQPYFRSLNILVVMFTIYFVFYLFDNSLISVHGYIAVRKLEYIKPVYISLLPTYVFFVFIKEGRVSEKWIKTTIIIFILISYIELVKTQNFAFENNEDVDKLTINAGYRFLYIFPILFLFKKKPIMQYLLIIVLSYFVLVCLKRGAIIIMFVCVLLLFNSNIKTQKGVKRVNGLLFIAISLAVSYYIVFSLVQSNEYFGYRVEQTLEGDTSGRDVLYRSAWIYFINNDNPLIFLFGKGANGTLKIMQQYAHNDWLEILINQGLIGVLIYCSYFISLIKTGRKIKNPMMNCIVVIILLTSLFSMSYGSMFLPINICLAYCLVEYDNTVNISLKV